MPPSIVTVSPPASSTGVLLNEPVTILFDQEIDEDSIRNGALIVSTTAYRVIRTGPTPIDYEDYIPPDTLSTNGFRGIIDGTYTFERINLTDTDSYEGVDDTTGDGSLWRTQVVFQPTLNFESSKSYSIILSADTSSRTIFDVVETKTGTGSILTKGPYTGSVDDTYTISITTAGNRQTGKFSWVRSSDGASGSDLDLSRIWYALDEDTNVYIKFEKGVYDSGDSFVFVVKPGEELTDLYAWSFQTGLVEGEAPEVPADLIEGSEVVGSTVIGDETPTSSFYISSVSPEQGSGNLPLSTSLITFRFSEEIDPTTVVVGTSIYAEGLSVDNIWNDNDDPLYPAMGDLDISVEVDGKILTVILGADSGSLLVNNNEIRIWLTEDIKSISDVALDDYLYYFTTRYSPIYADISQVYNKIGSAIGDTFPEDIIYRLLLRYSKTADILSYGITMEGETRWKLLRSEWVLCNTVADILKNAVALLGTSSAKKRLADLSITYDSSGSKLSGMLTEARKCIATLEEEMRRATTTTVCGGVKGARDPEDFNAGRYISPFADPALPYMNASFSAWIPSTQYVSGRFTRKILGNLRRHFLHE